MTKPDHTRHAANTTIDVVRLPGLTPYADGLAHQKRTCAAVESGDTGDTLLLLEHTPVITLGRNAEEKNLLRSRSAFEAIGIEVLEADRGGDVTYHGPGQLVAYPIINLSYRKQSVGWYLRHLEEAIITVLKQYGLTGTRVEGMTGVWVNGAKVAAIGIGVRNWITYHGMALNIDPNMEHFDLIVPCGIANKPVTSLRTLLNDSTPAITDVADAFALALHDALADPED